MSKITKECKFGARKKVREYSHACFRDGLRSVDFVLAYFNDQDEQKGDRRRQYLQNLKEIGMEMECECGQEAGELRFVKLHAPADMLNRVVEIFDLKIAFKPTEYQKDPRDGLFGFRKYLSCMYPRTRWSPEFPQDGDYSQLDRVALVWNILERVDYGDSDDEFGIERLLSSKTFSAAYPLHDAPGMRRMLSKEWASMLAFYKLQPIEHIRRYFGEEVGFYFDWLELYCFFLSVASIVGVLVFVICGTLSVFGVDTVASDEICSSDITLCPPCRDPTQCEFIPLRESCIYARLSQHVENSATVCFAVFMSVWAMVFCVSWERSESLRSWKWDVCHLKLHEPTRAEFEHNTRRQRLNPYTGKMELYVPGVEKLLRYAFSIAGVLFMTTAFVATIFGIVVYRVMVSEALLSIPSYYVKQYHKIAASSTGALLSLVIMVCMGWFYNKLAKFLTEMEKPRTESQYRDQYTFKVFVFAFINYYASLFYVAFFKGAFYTNPGSVGILNSDVCDPAGCLYELFINLAVIMIGKQSFFTFVEILKPRVKLWLRLKRHGVSKTTDLPQWEKEFFLNSFTRDTFFTAKLNTALQFGFVTLFVSAFPLAPLFALVNNVISIRTNALTMVKLTRRPVPCKVAGMRAWRGIIRGISIFAIVTNACVIAFTSQFIPRAYYRITHNNDLSGYINSSLSIYSTTDYDKGPLAYATCRYHGFRHPPSSPAKYEHSKEFWYILCARLAFVAIFDHFVFAFTLLLSYFIPKIPHSAREQMAAEEEKALEIRKKVANLKDNQTKTLAVGDAQHFQ